MTVWTDIEFAPKDGTLVDLWAVRTTPSLTYGFRAADCEWQAEEDGRPAVWYYADTGKAIE